MNDASRIIDDTTQGQSKAPPTFPATEPLSCLPVVHVRPTERLSVTAHNPGINDTDIITRLATFRLSTFFQPTEIYICSTH